MNIKFLILTITLMCLEVSVYACRVRIIQTGIVFNYIQGSTYTVEPAIRINRANQCRTLIFEVTPNNESEFVFKRNGVRLPINVSFDQNSNFGNVTALISTPINPVANGTYTYPFYINLVDPAIPESRIYNSRFTMRVYELEDPSVDLISRNNRHRLDVPPIFGINFNSAENAIDFGSLALGSESTLGMEVTGNIDYSVSMRSLEGGVLKNTFNPATIRYNMFWQGSPLALSSAWSVIGNLGVGDQVGVIRAVIDENTDGKTDGDYRDTVEVLIQTQ